MTVNLFIRAQQEVFFQFGLSFFASLKLRMLGSLLFVVNLRWVIWDLLTLLEKVVLSFISKMLLQC